MQSGVGLALAEAADLIPAQNAVFGDVPAFDEAADGRLLHDVHGEKRAFGHGIKVARVAEVFRPHPWHVPGIGRSQQHLAARMRPDLAKTDRAAVAARNAVDALFDARAADQEELAAGQAFPAVAPPEGPCLDQVRGRGPAAEEQVVEPRHGPPAQLLVAVIAVRAVQLIDERDLDMVLQVLADTGQVKDRPDPVMAEMRRRPDSIRSFGVATAPALRITSLRARRTRVRPRSTNSIPTALPFSTRIRETGAPVRSMRLRRRSAPCR
jgi:hypothetical protein